MDNKEVLRDLLRIIVPDTYANQVGHQVVTHQTGETQYYPRQIRRRKGHQPKQCHLYVRVPPPPDIQHHERGWRHKNNVQRYLKKQSKGMKKGNAQIAEERKRDQAKAKEKELEEIVEKDDGYYVVDGRPYMEGAFHLNLLRSRRDTLEIESSSSSQSESVDLSESENNKTPKVNENKKTIRNRVH